MINTLSPNTTEDFRRFKFSQDLTPISEATTQLYDEMITWESYRDSKNAERREVYLNRLLMMHTFIIRFWAKKFAQRSPQLWELEDTEQYARLAAIEAYNTYDATRNAKLKSWVYTKVHNILADKEEEDGLIKCPGRKANLRAYLAGHYDQNEAKKKGVEEAYDIRSEEDVNELRTKFSALTKVGYIEDELQALGSNEAHRFGRSNHRVVDLCADTKQVKEDDLLTVMDITSASSKLTERQREAISLVVFQQLSLEEIADQTDNTVSGVKALLFHARQKLRKAASED